MLLCEVSSAYAKALRAYEEAIRLMRVPTCSRPEALVSYVAAADRFHIPAYLQLMLTGYLLLLSNG
jgi:hypothetical protein